LPSESEFNSSAEADFAEKWGDEVRNGWTLRREAEVLYSWQKTFLPDFKFRRAEGKSAMMEIIGFWTPEYIAAHLATLEVFRETPILLAIHESTSHHFESAAARETIVTFKSALQVKAVLQALAILN
jgi:predicted nuclease of restriction endonuclease-like RecB superfamily